MLPAGIFAVLLAAAPVFAAKVVLPDVRTGNVNGKVGVLYWPAHPTPLGEEAEPLPSAENCEVHLVPRDDRDRELRYPCGKWFSPPAGRYMYWLEMPGRITPRQGISIYGDSPFRGAGLGAIIPVAPAGAIAIPKGRVLAAAESLRFVATSVKHSPGGNPWIFDRRVSAANARNPVQMPEGAALVGRFDAKSGDAIALSRPVSVPSGQTVTVWPEPPVMSDVLVILNRPPELQGSLEPVPTAMNLDDGARKRAADVLVNTANVIIAVWYGVDARLATVSLQAADAFWAPQEVRLVRGKVTTLRSQVQPLPKANVSIIAPSDAKLPETLDLEIARDREPVRRVPVTAGTHDITQLPAEVLTFTLHVGDWKQAKVVDLSSGVDANVLFELEPLTVSGTVYHGNLPAAAHIAFHNGEHEPVVETNDRGEYETTLWWPDVYTARVTLTGRNQPPFLDAFREIFTSGRIDFHVPRTDYRVRVVDAASGAAVAGARVMAGSVADGGRQSAQQLLTGEDGVAVLPPMRKGELLIDVHHERYAGMEPLRMTVDDEPHELRIALRPLAAATDLHLVLPDGTPAAQAEAFALDDAMNAVWRGTSAPDGTLSVPDIANGALLLVRHPKAATLIRRWDARNADATWSLGTPAEPLIVRAEPSTKVVLWLDGVRLAGPPLVIATWSVPMTNREGIWTARNLPARPVRVLTVAHDAMTSAAYDAVAREIPYPWPAVEPRP